MPFSFGDPGRSRVRGKGGGRTGDFLFLSGRGSFYVVQHSSTCVPISLQDCVPQPFVKIAPWKHGCGYTVTHHTCKANFTGGLGPVNGNIHEGSQIRATSNESKDPHFEARGQSGFVLRLVQRKSTINTAAERSTPLLLYLGFRNGSEGSIPHEWVREPYQRDITQNITPPPPPPALD